VCNNQWIYARNVYSRGSLFSVAHQPNLVRTVFEVSRSHTTRHTRAQRPLLTQHKTNTRRTTMCSAGLEPTTPAVERPQTCALDHMANGICFNPLLLHLIFATTTHEYPWDTHCFICNRGMQWRSWLKPCSTTGMSRVRFPVGSFGYFIDLILPARLSVGSTQHLPEMSTRSIYWRNKGGRCVGLTTLPPSCFVCLEILGGSTSWSLKDLTRPVMG
jgi:hypothetical protein